MEEVDKYKTLYNLQDEILAEINNIDTGFYLTGGTCVHRFYSKMRYSDDLDFFCNDNDYFRDYVRESNEKLSTLNRYYTTLIDTRDFVRCIYADKLKIDFVNDRVFRLGKTIKTDTGFKIDNIDNICANKISAIIGRDEPKDIFDIYTISKFKAVDWDEIIDAAFKKCHFEKDILIDRLISFPKELLKNVNTISPVSDDEIIDSISNIADIIQKL